MLLILNAKFKRNLTNHFFLKHVLYIIHLMKNELINSNLALNVYQFNIILSTTNTFFLTLYTIDNILLYLAQKFFSSKLAGCLCYDDIVDCSDIVVDCYYDIVVDKAYVVRPSLCKGEDVSHRSTAHVLQTRWVSSAVVVDGER